MKLGLVCISEILQESEKLSARTMTRKKFLSESRQDIITELSARILHNTGVLQRTLEHIHEIGISHYRVSSSMFPLVTDSTLDLSYDDLPDMPAIREALHAAGSYARYNHISLSCHPDQFNVLSSLNEDTVTRSIRQLNHESAVMDMLGCAQDLSSPMCLHLNRSPKAEESIDDYVERFMTHYYMCDIGVRKRLALENEDKGFWNCYNLYEAFRERMPLVYDNLHDSCNPSPIIAGFDNPITIAALYQRTWRGHVPVFHWSEGIDNSSKHARYFSHIPEVVKRNPDIIFECEVKAKDNAILQVLNGDIK